MPGEDAVWAPRPGTRLRVHPSSLGAVTVHAWQGRAGSFPCVTGGASAVTEQKASV